MKNTRSGESLPPLAALAALAALPYPSPNPLLQDLVSHAPEVRMTVVAQGTTPSNYSYCQIHLVPQSPAACSILPRWSIGDPLELDRFDRLESIDRRSVRGDPLGLDRFDRLESIDRGSPRARSIGWKIKDSNLFFFAFFQPLSNHLPAD